MAKIKLSLQPSEAVVAQCASSIYAAYLMAGRVPVGKEDDWIERSIRDAIEIARLSDEAIQSDSEMA